jgi:broad-specificity NMP kinase
MTEIFVVVVTGVPASGKSVFAKKLGSRLRDSTIIELNDLVKKYKAYSGKDRFGSYIVNLRKLDMAVKLALERSRKRNIILVGHLAPAVSVHADILVVIREKLEKLAGRMERRGYKKEKIAENLSAEISMEWLRRRRRIKCKEVYEIESAKDRRAIISYIVARSYGKKRKKPDAAAIGNRMKELMTLIKKGNRYGL